MLPTRTRGGALSAGALGLLLGSLFAAHGSDDADQEYALFLQENGSASDRIEEIDSLIEDDPELEASFTAQADSLAAHPELAAQEESLADALEADPALATSRGEYEDALAQETDGATQAATFDSLMAADPRLAELMEEIEREAGSDSELLDEHGDAMAYLEAHPEESVALFAEESGPTYTGSDAVVVAYVTYLELHPTYYRSWWRLHRHLRAHPPQARVLYAHWRWRKARPRLWHAGWSYRLRLARAPRIHQLYWKQRLYLGHRPALARELWRHRVLVARKPALAAHRRYLRRHPGVAHRVALHRTWVRRHAHPSRKIATRPARVVKPRAHPRRR